ncbi:c-type cytochrome [Halomonas sp. NO4]|uniref:c-type cytochrome n=1 Tax=Halomonas sp. NO4 TaxID=2484813 RepID=UPI0013D24DE9|nr:c-type cytochrome [Halomonas sp. NO4]
MKLLSAALFVGASTLAFTAMAQEEPDGEAVYNQACMACHMTGAAGAPIKGDTEAWAPRIEKGMETLYDHSINGFNAMPAKGGQAQLSDEQVKAAVDYMVEDSQ